MHRSMRMPVCSCVSTPQQRVRHNVMRNFYALWVHSVVSRPLATWYRVWSSGLRFFFFFICAASL